MYTISESYVVGFDSNGPDDAMLTVAKINGNKIDHLITLEGQDAIELHDKIINNKNWKGNK